MKCDGPGARATRAVKGREVFRWYSLLRTPTQQPFDATHLLTQRGKPYKGFTVVSRSKFDGGVSVDNPVLTTVPRSIVKAARAHVRKDDRQAPSESTGKVVRG
jgi:hypothetical protein